MNIRNIGIFAHVDAGKTTLSEQLLMHAGAIRRVGSVDEGTAHTDNLPVEQRRGISVKATYLGNQLHSLYGGSRCFGIVANMQFLLVCTYGALGDAPELLLYKQR